MIEPILAQFDGMANWKEIYLLLPTLIIEPFVHMQEKFKNAVISPKNGCYLSGIWNDKKK